MSYEQTGKFDGSSEEFDRLCDICFRVSLQMNNIECFHKLLEKSHQPHIWRSGTSKERGIYSRMIHFVRLCVEEMGYHHFLVSQAKVAVSVVREFEQGRISVGDEKSTLKFIQQKFQNFPGFYSLDERM